MGGGEGLRWRGGVGRLPDVPLVALDAKIYFSCCTGAWFPSLNVEDVSLLELSVMVLKTLQFK